MANYRLLHFPQMLLFNRTRDQGHSPAEKKRSSSFDLSPFQPQDRYSWLWLAFGAILSPFAGGRWIIPLAAWFAPLFFLRFVRTQRPLTGFLLVALVRTVAGAFTLQGVIPVQGIVFYGVLVIINLVTTLPYLADRLISPRLQGFPSTLVFPTAYTTLEFLSSSGPFGTMTSIAISQYGNLPLLQVVSVTGIWGITFLITWFAAVVNWIWGHGFEWRQVRSGVLLYTGILSAVLLGGGARLALFPPQASLVRVAGLTASKAVLDQQDQQISMDTQMALTGGKATPAQLALARTAYAPAAQDLLARSQEEARAGAKIIVWPEVGVSVLQEDEQALIQRASTLARQEGVTLDLGLAVIIHNGNPGPSVKDEVVVIGPSGSVLASYEKTHLVPFGETGLVIPGNGRVPILDTPAGRLATVICFDLDFPSMIRQAGQSGAALMLAPSNDWLEVDPMHTQAATFRAIENGFSLVRQTSHGLAMTVDYQGRVLGASDFFTAGQQIMVTYVPVRGVHTIYAALGDWFALVNVICLVSLFGLAILLGRRRASMAATPVPATGSQPTDDSTL